MSVQAKVKSDVTGLGRVGLNGGGSTTGDRPGSIRAAATREAGDKAEIFPPVGRSGKLQLLLVPRGTLPSAHRDSDTV